MATRPPVSATGPRRSPTGSGRRGAAPPRGSYGSKGDEDCCRAERMRQPADAGDREHRIARTGGGSEPNGSANPPRPAEERSSPIAAVGRSGRHCPEPCSAANRIGKADRFAPGRVRSAAPVAERSRLQEGLNGAWPDAAGSPGARCRVDCHPGRVRARDVSGRHPAVGGSPATSHVPAAFWRDSVGWAAGPTNPGTPTFDEAEVTFPGFGPAAPGAVGGRRSPCQGRLDGVAPRRVERSERPHESEAASQHHVAVRNGLVAGK